MQWNKDQNQLSEFETRKSQLWEAIAINQFDKSTTVDK